VYCANCRHEYLLAFSCRGRWFCPSCHAKKVVQFGQLLRENILYPVPHRQYVFSIPIILRKYFLYNNKLFSKLCKCVADSLLSLLRTVIGLEEGICGAVMTIQTFGDYAKWHPHIHSLVPDGLFRNSGIFYVMPRNSIRPLAELFQANMLKMLQKEGLIDDSFISMIMKWRYTSGFSVDNSVRIKRGDADGLTALCRDTPIMVLDEATAFVDTETESILEHALTEILSNRTSLIIAHRLTTVQQADKIVVLENGRIVEQGTHYDLMRAEKNYYRLVSIDQHFDHRNESI